MPTTVRNGVRIHFTDEGEGPPLLLIAGLGADSRAWDPLLEALRPGRRLIALDNRGSGHSGPAAGDTSIAAMAADAAAVLDDLGIGRADVAGNSLGGMIAQELTARHPRRVRSLLLCATSPGILCVPSHPALPWHMLRAARSAGEARTRHLAAALHGPATLVDDPARLDPAALDLPAGDGMRAQLRAALRWSGLRALPRVEAPTLVLHGSHDRLVPLLNARLMARLIPGARLEVMERAGHFFITDTPGVAGSAMQGFLQAVDAGLVRPPVRSGAPLRSPRRPAAALQGPAAQPA